MLYSYLMKILLFNMIMLTPFTPIEKLFPTLNIIRQYSMLVFVVMIGLYCLVRKSFIDVGFYQVLIYLIAIVLWSGIGIYNGYPALNEASPLIMMLITFISVVIAHKKGIVEKSYIQKIAFLLMIVWCGIYSMFAIGIMLGIIPKQMFMPILDVYMQANSSIDMGSGFLGILPRIGAGVNIVPLIIYGFYIRENKRWDLLIWILLLLYVIVDYGRIDMFLFVLLSLIKLYYYLNNKSNKKICKLLFALLTLLIFSYVMMSTSNISIEEFYDGWTARYERPSDERTMQVKFLNEYVETNYVIGYGLGAFTPEYTRSPNHWVYEMQFNAFVMQMGVLGFTMIVLNYLLLFFRTVYNGIDKKYLSITCVCVSLWLIDCMFQGGLYHNDGRVICIIIYMLSRMNSYDKWEKR